MPNNTARPGRPRRSVRVIPVGDRRGRRLERVTQRWLAELAGGDAVVARLPDDLNGHAPAVEERTAQPEPPAPGTT